MRKEFRLWKLCQQKRYWSVPKPALKFWKTSHGIEQHLLIICKFINAVTIFSGLDELNSWIQFLNSNTTSTNTRSNWHFIPYTHEWRCRLNRKLMVAVLSLFRYSNPVYGLLCRWSHGAIIRLTSFWKFAGNHENVTLFLAAYPN